MQTRKYPRTLQEAFGPHTSREVLEKSGGYHLSDKIVLWGSGIAAVVMVALVVIGVIQ